MTSPPRLRRCASAIPFLIFCTAQKLPADSLAPLAAPFAVSDYQIQDFHELEVLLNGSGGYSDGQSENNSFNPYASDYDQFSGENFNFRPQLQWTQVSHSQDSGANLSLVGNFRNQPINSDHETRLEAFPNYSVTNGSSDQSEGFSISPSLSLTRYAGLLQWGISISGSLAASQDNSSSSYLDQNPPFTPYSDSSSEQSSAFTLQGLCTAKLGLGRLVDSRWAWRALELADELAKEGLLLKPISPGDMQELSGLVALNGQRLIWDNRDLRRQNTRALLAFLLKQGYVKAESSETVMAVYEVDAYQSVARLNGSQAYAFISGSDGQSWNQTSGTEIEDGVVQPLYFPGDYNFVTQSSPGPGLELDRSLPLSQAWQLDLSSRSSYQPYARVESSQAQSVYRNWHETLNANLSCYPNTRNSLSFAFQGSLSGARYEYSDYDFTSGTWIPGLAYDAIDISALGTLSYACQLAPYLVASLSASAQYNQENRRNEGYPPPAYPTGDYGNWGWSESLSTSLSWRVL